MPIASPSAGPNTPFRRLRGDLSPGEFAALVRRAAREIGETVSCDARYIGRVETGEIRCPNYAYERVFRHLFPGRSLTDMGFAPREVVRNRRPGGSRSEGTYGPDDGPDDEPDDEPRRAFMAGGRRPAGHVGSGNVHAVEEAVRWIRLQDDRHGADGLYAAAGRALRTACRLLDEGPYSQPLAHGLYAVTGELAVSVGWLAHDSGRPTDARSHYAEALATARMAGDAALEAHAFCNTAFLARDAGRPREAVRAAQAAQAAAKRLGSPRLLSLLVLREAGGRAGLGDRTGCERALVRAHSLFARGRSDADPPWMTFFGEAELAGLEAQSWSALGDHRRAADAACRAVRLQDPHFARNIALYEAESAANLAAAGEPEAAACAASRASGLLGRVRSGRVRGVLGAAARALRPYEREPAVADFLALRATLT